MVIWSNFVAVRASMPVVLAMKVAMGGIRGSRSFLVGEVAVVLCLGCDPGADQGLEVGVVCLYGVDDGVVVNVAEGSLDVD